MPGVKGFGTILEYSADSGTTWVAIGNVTKIRPFALKADVVDVSSHSSPGEYREKLAGFKNAGQLQFDLNYNNGAVSHQFLAANLGASLMWRVTFPGSNTGFNKATFAGFLADLNPEAPHDNKMSASATVDISSTITWAT
jgi:predicted secreted protein